MKGKFRIIIVALAIMCISHVSPAESPKQVLDYTNYTWYRDTDMTDPTGTICDISVEVNRLRNLFGGFRFTTTPSMGLHSFEYGYYPNYPFAIIYSDLGE